MWSLWKDIDVTVWKSVAWFCHQILKDLHFTVSADVTCFCLASSQLEVDYSHPEGCRKVDLEMIVVLVTLRFSVYILNWCSS